MQKARDYLVELGLAIPGARGKFSVNAKKALQEAMANGIKFADYDERGSTTRRRIVFIPSDQPMPGKEAAKKKNPTLRAENRLRITDSNGITMDLEYCSLGHEIQMCSCKTVYAPAYFNAVSSQLIIT